MNGYFSGIAFLPAGDKKWIQFSTQVVGQSKQTKTSANVAATNKNLNAMCIAVDIGDILSHAIHFLCASWGWCAHECCSISSS